jgi:uncharacterized coiled-coil protein SlyX
MSDEERSASLRREIDELQEELARLMDRAKKTARDAEVLCERMKRLEKSAAKQA